VHEDVQLCLGCECVVRRVLMQLFWLRCGGGRGGGAECGDMNGWKACVDVIVDVREE
jgi:hypothetical protein